MHLFHEVTIRQRCKLCSTLMKNTFVLPKVVNVLRGRRFVYEHLFTNSFCGVVWMTNGLVVGKQQIACLLWPIPFWQEWRSLTRIGSSVCARVHVSLWVSVCVSKSQTWHMSWQILQRVIQNLRACPCVTDAEGDGLLFLSHISPYTSPT